MRTITLTIEVEGIESQSALEDFGSAVVEHLMDTFNDNGSIRSVSFDVKEEEGK